MALCPYGRVYMVVTVPTISLTVPYLSKKINVFVDTLFLANEVLNNWRKINGLMKL